MKFLVPIVMGAAMLAAQRPPEGGPPGGPGGPGAVALNPALSKELKAYQLSLAGLRKFANAQKKLNEMRAKDPELSKRLGAFQQDRANAQAASLDEIGARFQRQFPTVSAAFRAQGLTPKEYTLNLILVLEATFSGVLGGQGFGPPPADLSAENVAFLRGHVQEVVTMLQPAMQPMMQAPMGPPGPPPGPRGAERQ